MVPVTDTGEVTTAVVAGAIGAGAVICTVGGFVAAALTVTVPLATPVLPAASQALAWTLYEGWLRLAWAGEVAALLRGLKAVGRLDRDVLQYQVLADTLATDPLELENRVIASKNGQSIRLRDLGGIIVIDFIDMDERRNRQRVMQALEEALKSDRAPSKVLQFNDFGLVAITRKRVKQSLERTLCSPCPYCESAGYVKSVQTVVADILQEAHKIAKAVEGKDVLLRVNPEVAKFSKSNQNKYREEMEEVLRRPVLVKSDPSLHQEKFDLA